MNAPLLILATSGPHAEVGLLTPEGLSVRVLGEGAARGRGLLPAVAEALRARDLAPGDLRGLIVDVGPGSFTGVRVGVTAAKSLAFALGLPVVAVLSLEALAEAAAEPGAVLTLRDAGRGTAYAALYGPRGEGPRPVLRAPARVDLSALAAWGGPALAVGEEADRLLREAGLAGPAQRVQADAAAVLAVGRPRLDAGGGQDPATLVPLYLQASAPERLRDAERGEPTPARPRDRSPR